MLLTDEDIEKFQDIFEKEFGTKITKDEAYEKGVKLLTLMSAIYKPMTEKEYVLVEERRNESVESVKNIFNKK